MSPQVLHRILFTRIFTQSPSHIPILQHFPRLVNRIVFQVEHKKVCGTHVEGFALKLLNGVWNTPYPAIPKRICVFGWFPPPAERKRHACRGAYKREKNHSSGPYVRGVIIVNCVFSLIKTFPTPDSRYQGWLYN